MNSNNPYNLILAALLSGVKVKRPVQRNVPQVVRVDWIWAKIYRVTYKFKGNGRHYSELFRPIDGIWHSGEAFPCGTKSSPLRKAPPQFVPALDLALNNQA